MRILILSANTGNGHNATAKSVGERLERLGAECETVDALRFISEKVSRFISWGHSYVYRRLPKLFGRAYRYEENHPPKFIYDQCIKGADALLEKLSGGNYDAVLCVHVFSAMMMTELRKRGKTSVRTYFLATDYTCSPGVSELDMDGFFIPHAALTDEFLHAGIPAEKLIPTGIPIRTEFCEAEDRAAARAKLGLPADRTLAAVSFGSMGCGHLEKWAPRLLRAIPKDAGLVVLCGNNEKLYRSLLPYTKKNGMAERLFPVAFTDEVFSYMSACDLNVTKPGGLTVTESVAKRLPMVLLDAVAGCERRNLEFMTRMEIAQGAADWKAVIPMIVDLLQNREKREAQRTRMKDLLPPDAPGAICTILLGNAGNGAPKIELRPRTEATVRTYFERAQDEEIKKTLPQKAKTVEEALADYEKTLLPDATSYGKSVYADGVHVGDVWAYCIGGGDPDAMLSFCIFKKSLWGKGIATEAVRQFLSEIQTKYRLKTVGAFTYSKNAASRKVLQANGFREVETFTEDGKESKYLQLELKEGNL